MTSDTFLSDSKKRERTLDCVAARSSLLDMLEDYGAAKRWINNVRIWLKSVLQGNQKIEEFY